MHENAANNNVRQQYNTAVTTEEIVIIHKVRRLLKPGTDVVLKLDSKGKTKIYRLTQEAG